MSDISDIIITTCRGLISSHEKSQYLYCVKIDYKNTLCITFNPDKDYYSYAGISLTLITPNHRYELNVMKDSIMSFDEDMSVGIGSYHEGYDIWFSKVISLIGEDQLLLSFSELLITVI